MPSSPHTAAQLAQMQTQFTAAKTSATNMAAVGNRSASAAAAADAQILQDTVTREAEAKLT